ncbi:hypothetical protein [Litoribacter populi]|uniref:hypothetical protein n=1 Tax=Litoribacter populi TaxID=2598460 RepID=UPI00117F0DA5|nr:hypothetical protein [Litoribacter populi]
MKQLNHMFKYLTVFAVMAAFSSCSEDENTPDPSINMTISGEEVESTNPGEYSYRVESGNEVNLTVNLQSAVPLTNLVITKTVNNAVDADYGTGGSTTVDLSGNESSHAFNYTPEVDDVDQLVGFNFRGTNSTGATEEIDLILVVNMSPIDNLTRRRWLLTSVFHVNEDEEGINDCEKDNSMLLNEDGSIDIDYGDVACDFDGFTEYTEWYITEEDGVQYFTREGYGIFDPETVIVDTYMIVELTTEEIQLQQTMDLSDFGESTEETFIFTYVATPR